MESRRSFLILYFVSVFKASISVFVLNIISLKGKNLPVKPFSFINPRVKILPMYLREILDENDVYDFIHTNPNGNLKIAEYLRDNLK